MLKPTRCWLQSPILSARAGVNHIFIWIITHPSYSTKHWFLRWWFQLEQWSHLSSWNVPNHWIWFSPWIQTKLIWIWYWIDTFNIFIHPQWCYVQGCGAVCLPGASCSVTKNNGMKRRVWPLLLSILVRGHWSSPRHGAELHWGLFEKVVKLLTKELSRTLTCSILMQSFVGASRTSFSIFWCYCMLLFVFSVLIHIV